MIDTLYILQNGHYSKFSQHLTPHITICFFLWWEFSRSILSTFQTTNTILTIVIIQTLHPQNLPNLKFVPSDHFYICSPTSILGFPGGSVVKNLPANAGSTRDAGSIRCWEDPLEQEMAICSSILVWKIPRTKEPGGLLSVGSQRVGHDWAHTHPLPSKPRLNEVMFVILWFISLHIMPSSFTHCIQIDILLPLIQHLKNLHACTLTLFLLVYITQGLQFLQWKVAFLIYQV